MSNVVALAAVLSPYVIVYPWSPGFGTKFSNPSILPAGTGSSVAISPSGSFLAVAHNNTPFVTVYRFYGNAFGTKFSDPGTTPTTQGRSVAFTSNEDAIAVGGGGSPFLTAYPWSSSGFGSKFSNPATLPPGSVYSTRFALSAELVGVGNAGCSGYPWSTSGFGTKFTNPGGSGTSSNCNGCAVTSNGDAFAVAERASPYIEAFPLSGSGFGSKFTNPGTAMPDRGSSLGFSNARDVLASTTYGSQKILAYHWSSSSGFGSKFANPGTDLAQTGQTGDGLTFSANDQFVFATANKTGGGYLSAWAFSSSSGWGTKYTDAAGIPTGAGGSCSGIAYGSPGTVTTAPDKVYSLSLFNAPVSLRYNFGNGFGIFIR